MRTPKTLIRLGGCPDWSEAGRTCHFVGFVMWWLKSYKWQVNSLNCWLTVRLTEKSVGYFSDLVRSRLIVMQNAPSTITYSDNLYSKSPFSPLISPNLFPSKRWLNARISAAFTETRINTVLKDIVKILSPSSVIVSSAGPNVRVTKRVKKIMLNTTSIRRMRVVFNLIFFTSFVTYL